jgi:hypothetical protein
MMAASLHAVEGAAYLKGAEGVRSSALAGAFSAAAGSAESLWYNPAGLSGLRGAEASFTHSSLDNAFDTDHIVAAAFLGWQHSFGLMYSRKGAQDTYRDASANSAGSFEVSNSVLGLGYAYDLGGLSLGLELKMLNEKVEKLSGSSTAYDFGMQGTFDKDQVLYGLSYQNLGSAPSLGGPEASLPQTLRAGLGWKAGDPSQQLLVMGDYRYLPASSKGGFALGAEYSEAYDESSLALRAGWDFGQSQLGGVSGLSLGAGFAYKFLGIDYAWIPLDVLGSSHRIALTLVYDQKSAEREKSMNSYLGINPQAAPLPTPTRAPTPRPREANIGAELSALMAETPTPMPTPTPEIRAAAKEPAKGLIGAIFSIFSFGKKSEAKDEEPAKKGGLLKGLFSIFGISGSEDQPVDAAPDKPQASPSDEDSFVKPGQSAAPAKDAGPQATPTLQATPALQKMKGWVSF